jgi:hypothetical protein
MKKFLLIACVAVLTVAFAMPATAATKVGGIIFNAIMWDSRDEERMGRNGNPFGGAPLPNVSDNTTVSVFNGLHSRLYTRWTNEDNVGLFIELGLGGSPGSVAHSGAAGGESVYLRHLYGWYDVSPSFRFKFGLTTSLWGPLNGSDLMGFTVGQDGTQSGAFPGFTAHGILQGYGNVYVEREPQIRGEWTFGPHFLRIALSDWRNSATSIATIGYRSAAGTVVAEDTVFPRLEVGAKLQTGPVAWYPGFIYLNRTFDGVLAGDDDDVDAWGFSIGAKAGWGPITIVAEAQAGENWGDMGLNDAATSFAMVTSGSQTVLVGTQNKVFDTEMFAGFIDVGFKFGIATLQARFGVTTSENTDPAGVASDYEFKSTAFGLSLPINIAKGFIIRPEAMWYDEGDEPVGGVVTDWGKQAQYGVQFQVVF